MVVASEAHVVGRDEELAVLREFVASAVHGPRAMGIRGEPGIGKTTLWHAAIEVAETAGVRVLSARCVEAELPLAFVGLSDLVQDAFPAVADELTTNDRAALAVAVGLEAPQRPPADAIALPRAFLALLRALAREVPVLLAIDEVQWLDAPSARVVSFALRRLGDTRVAILVTQRDGGNDPLGLASMFGERLEEVRLGPLSLGALAHLVRTRLGVRIPRPVLARVHDASGGNPMFALEFARASAEHGAPQLGPVPMPASLQELVRARLELQPPAGRRLLAIVAACGHPTRSLLGAVDPATAGSLDAAVDAGLITVGGEGAVRFTHPLLASAAYADLPPSQRRTVHAQIAQALEEVEARARHLALARPEPDAGVAALLDDAAARANARGAPESAAELAQAAVRLTPAGAAGLDERKLSVAEYLTETGLTTETAEWLDLLLASGLTGRIRARALFLRCWAEPDLEAQRGILAEALQHAGDDATVRVPLLLALSSLRLTWDNPDVAASERAAREALATADSAGDPQLLAAALSIVADRADLAGHPDDALAERAIELEDVHGPPVGFTTSRSRLAEGRLRRGDLGGARGLREVELEAALHRYVALHGLFDVEWRAGNWQLAELYLEEAWSVGVDDARHQVA